MQSLPQRTAPLYACEVAITLCRVVLVLWALPLSAQRRIGEVHLKVTDPKVWAREVQWNSSARRTATSNHF
jgi:hypothetical protein